MEGSRLSICEKRLFFFLFDRISVIQQNGPYNGTALENIIYNTQAMFFSFVNGFRLSFWVQRETNPR